MRPDYAIRSVADLAWRQQCIQEILTYENAYDVWESTEGIKGGKSDWKKYTVGVIPQWLICFLQA